MDNRQPILRRSWRFPVASILVLLALGILAWMAFQALQLQRSHTIREDLGQTINRIRKSAESAIAEIPQQIKHLPNIRFPLNTPTLDDLTWPTDEASLNRFLQASISSSTAHVYFLEGWLNESGERKQFWLFLAAHAHMRMNHFSEAARLLRRLLHGENDVLLPNGWSLKAMAALKGSQIGDRMGDSFEAEELLKSLGSFPQPRNEALKLLRDWKPKNMASLGRWQRMLLWAWSYQRNVNQLEPGFYSAETLTTNRETPQSELILVSRAGPSGATILTPGKDIFDNIINKVQQTAGDNWLVTPPAATASKPLLLRNFKQLDFQPRPTISGNISKPDFGHLSLAGIVGLGALALAFLFFTGIRQEHETSLLSEQETFFRQAAHDLKTPLTGIRTLAETLLLKRYRDEDQRNSYLHRLLNEVDRASYTVDAMLLSARLRFGLIQVAPQDIEVGNTIREILDRFSPRLMGWKVEVQLKEGLTLHIDPVLFERLIENLLENVFKHAAAGKVITIIADSDKSKTVYVNIGDRGKGLPQHFQPAAIFQRGHSPSANIKSGSGFGLAIAAQILAKFKGKIGFMPREDGGLWVQLTFFNRFEGTKDDKASRN